MRIELPHWSRIELKAKGVSSRMLTKCISWTRRLPWSQPRYHTCSSSWELRRLLLRCVRDSSCTPAFWPEMAYIHHKLMRSADKLKVVGVIELFWDVLTEGVAGAARWDTPTASVIGVRPQQVTDWTKEFIKCRVTLRGGLLALCRVVWFDLGCRLRVISHREDRRFGFRQLLWVGSSRKVLWNISKHWHCHIFSDTRRRIHT